MGLCARVLNALDLVHFIMGAPQTRSAKDGGSWGQGKSMGQLYSTPHLEPPNELM